MAFLLDTHTFLWFISADKQLSKQAKLTIEDLNKPCYLSIASLWEITIKFQLSKLILGISLKELFAYLDRNHISVIPIETNHLLELSKLPIHHNDPFDRLIVSQAKAEKFILISKDKKLKDYKIDLLWNE